ncbi:hypothetical protein E1B28_007013 [Marasmius oreades]|uniref:Uncharacterized protein n=1 Tax=Marasmius oreades TaxID=181124 RepID=A0A9P7UTC2_9AGAR|nr:uncharacterized protein E1B28_007013 [Marasmius oreades]KAG7093333.1 hypothetical protein E1B28_007013 [Marasmius oreades]
MAKITQSEKDQEPQVSPRKVRPIPSRKSLRAVAKRQEEERQARETDELDVMTLEEDDLGSSKTRRSPRKPLARTARNGNAANGKNRARPSTKLLNVDVTGVAEDEEYNSLDDEEEGDLGVVGHGRAGSRKRLEKDYDSDALDDDESEPRKTKRTSTKRKRDLKSPSKKSPTKKRRRIEKDEDEDDDVLELKEGQEVVGLVVQAPKTGQVPAGQISKNTLDFLSMLADPACNDREWYAILDLDLPT